MCIITYIFSTLLLQPDSCIQGLYLSSFGFSKCNSRGKSDHTARCILLAEEEKEEAVVHNSILPFRQCRGVA